MADKDTKEELIRESEVNAGWLRVVSAVMDGRMPPREAVARLEALAAENACDAEWLRDEADTIRWTFCLDIEEAVAQGKDYWDEILAVAEGLLDERVAPSQAVDLLERVRAQFPDQGDHVQTLIHDIVHSPVWQSVDAGA